MLPHLLRMQEQGYIDCIHPLLTIVAWLAPPTSLACPVLSRDPAAEGDIKKVDLHPLLKTFAMEKFIKEKPSLWNSLKV